MKTEAAKPKADDRSLQHNEQAPNQIDLPSPRPKKKWNPFLLVLFALAPGIVFVTGWLVMSEISAKKAETTAPAPTPAVTPVTIIGALGRLEPEGEVLKVAPPSTLGSSRIVKLLVKEGQTVQINQVLAQLDGYDRTVGTVKQAEAQVGVRRSQLAQVKAGAKSGDIDAQKATTSARRASLERQKSELVLAEADLRRYNALVADGAASEIIRDGYALKVKTLSGQIAQTEKEILQSTNLATSVAEVRPTDVQFAEAQLTSAIADLEKAKIELKYTEVRAPITGEILKVIAKAGEAVSGSSGVVEMGNTKQMYAVAEVYETDVSKIKVGQKATISSEVLNGEVSGIVDRISLRVAKNDVLGTDPATRTDVRVIEVKIRLKESQKVAGFTNMQVKVRIDVGEK